MNFLKVRAFNMKSENLEKKVKFKKSFKKLK